MKVSQPPMATRPSSGGLPAASAARAWLTVWTASPSTVVGRPALAGDGDVRNARLATRTAIATTATALAAKAGTAQRRVGRPNLPRPVVVAASSVAPTRSAGTAWAARPR